MTTPTDFREAVREDQRLRVLQALTRAPDYTAPAALLLADLRIHGHAVPSDALRAQLAWLDEAGLIILMGDLVPVARLTQRGEEVASGTARHPGVARPGP
jgi:hypothetical protein